MTKNEAKNYIKYSSTVEREAFSFTFTQTTRQEPSKETFEKAVEELGGWIVKRLDYDYYPNRKYHPNTKYHVYETVACVPAALD